MVFPPHHEKPHSNCHYEKRDNLEDTSGGEWNAFEPQNEQHRGGKRTGGCLAEEGQSEEYQGGDVKQNCFWSRFIIENKFKPAKNRQKRKQKHEEVFPFGNPGDGFNLNRVESKDGGGKPGARDGQPAENQPQEQGIYDMNGDIYDVIADGVEAPEAILQPERCVCEGKKL